MTKNKKPFQEINVFDPFFILTSKPVFPNSDIKVYDYRKETVENVGTNKEKDPNVRILNFDFVVKATTRNKNIETFEEGDVLLDFDQLVSVIGAKGEEGLKAAKKNLEMAKEELAAAENYMKWVATLDKEGDSSDKEGKTHIVSKEK